MDCSAPEATGSIAKLMIRQGTNTKIRDWAPPQLSKPPRPADSVKAAVKALWSFYNRPPEHDVRWYLADDLAAFAARVTRDPHALVAACRDVLYHPDVERSEANALRPVVEMGQALDLSATRCDPLTADLRVGLVQYRVAVQNLSSHGARIERVGALTIGDPASFRLSGGTWITGVIVWLLDNGAGLAFDQGVRTV